MNTVISEDFGIGAEEGLMKMEDFLLLFDEQTPCWRRDMLKLAGVDTKILETFASEGFLLEQNGIFYLSPGGARRFCQLASEAFLPLKPGIVGEIDIKRNSDRSFLQYLLDKHHIQRRGIKEYCKPFRFEIPELRHEEKYAFDGENVVWRYPKARSIQDIFDSFPSTGWAARRNPSYIPDDIEKWLNEHVADRQIVEADLLYKCHYDFQHYLNFPKIPSDIYSLLNTDRYFFFFAAQPYPNNLDYFFTTLEEFQIFMFLLEHLYLPGSLRHDSLEQHSYTWLLFAYEGEDDAWRCEKLLNRYKHFLSGPTASFEVWSISIQALKEYEGSAELINDLLPSVAKPILRNS